jgi:hypothetical protein
LAVAEPLEDNFLHLADDGCLFPFGNVGEELVEPLLEFGMYDMVVSVSW